MADSQPDYFQEAIEAEEALSPEEEMQRLREAAGNIVSRLNTLAEDAVQKRTSIEERWLSDLRAYQGRYDKEVEQMLRQAQKAGKTKARAYIKICRSKTDAWEARLSDLLFPADERNWGIKPTPVPELTDQAERAVEEAAKQDRIAEEQTAIANQLEAEGAPPEQIAAALDQAAKAAQDMKTFATIAEEAQAKLDEAQKRAEAMAKEIDDQLTESKYPARSRDAIRDAVRLGVGVMKGPLVSNRAKRRWTKGDGNSFMLEDVADESVEYRRVDPWHYFPDPNATCKDDCTYEFERHMPTPRDLRKMVKTLGFDKDAVRELLRDGAGYGLDTSLSFLNELRDINDEGIAMTGRFIMWEYTGPLECDEICTLLRAVGRDEEARRWEERNDPLDEYMVTCFFCNGKLLKLSEHYVLDSGDSLYSVFSFSPGEASILGGRGVPNLMHDTLRALNAAWRMMLDNAALAVAPQIVVDKRVIVPENGNWNIAAGKTWWRTDDDIGTQPGSGQRAFEIHDIPMNQAQIAGIIDLCLKFIDEETSLPLIAQGEQGQHITQTMGGMTMLFNSANVVFRRVVKNWDDDVTAPNIRRLYDFNMQFSEKDEIKGDMQIEARGTSFLLVREMQSQNLMIIATQWSEHPTLRHAIKVYSTLRMAIQSLGISPDDILETEEQFLKNLEASQANAAQNPDVIRAQATIDAANITAESRKADGEVQKEIALIRRETELIQLAEARGMKLEDLKTKLAMKGMELQSKERTLAAEAGIQQQAREEARAMGQDAPSGGGGTV